MEPAWNPVRFERVAPIHEMEVKVREGRVARVSNFAKGFSLGY